MMKRTQSRFVMFWLASVLLAMSGLATAALPSAGTILHQTQPPVALPTAPGATLTLPVPKNQPSQSSVRFSVKQIRLRGNTLIATARLQPLVDGLQGHKASLGELQQGAARITALYHASGYPLAYAYLPAQKIKHGVVTIAIVEPTYDQINIKGNTRLDPELARNTLGIQPGSPVEQAGLSRGLLLLNRTPGIRVAGTLVPGAQAGTSTLDVHIKDTPVVRGSLGFDNHGSKYTGRLRGLAQVSIDDPFGVGGQIAANGLTTESGLLQAVGVNILSPNLGYGTRLSLYGSHTSYDLGDVFAPLQISGQADQIGLAINAPVILAPGRLLTIRLDLLRNDFQQTSPLLGLDDESHINLVRLTFTGAWADSSGGLTSGGLLITRGDKHIETAATRAADAAGAQTQGEFWIAQVKLEHIQPLGHHFRLKAGISGQLASANLDGSQKLYLGGPRGVMSYPVGSAGGDQGLLAKLSLSHPLDLRLPGQLRGAVLLQGGTIWRHHSDYPGAATPNRIELAGAGVGLDYQWNNAVSLHCSYVHELGHSPAIGGSDPNDEIWFSLRISG